MRIVFLTLLISLAGSSAQAHKVIYAYWVAGPLIEGEIGYSNGSFAANAQVHVMDQTGNTIGRIETDKDGLFSYQPVSSDQLRFRTDLGAGHIADFTVPSDELPLEFRVGGQPAPNLGAQARPSRANSSNLSGASTEAIAAAVRAEVQPLRREVAKLRNQTNLQSILGGLGYVLGMIGLYSLFISWRAGRFLISKDE